MKGFANMTVRFFIYGYENGDLEEVNETDFIDAPIGQEDSHYNRGIPVY